MTVSSRIIFNTVVLYTKVIITTLVSLYLTRVVLGVLGVEDFGLYSLIAGVVSFMAFLNTALMTSTQRFISVAIGAADNSRVNRIFSASLLIHLLLALLVYAIIEILGLFIFDGVLNIPAGREAVAKVVYHLMAFTTVITIIGTPYNAAINSYEDMWYFAIVEIAASVLKLGVIFGFKVVNIEALVLYALWILGVTVVSFVAKYLWCKCRYRALSPVSLSLKSNSDTIKEMSGFIGWNTVGSFAVLLRNQGVAVVINLFFSTVINAVYGIANQVSSQLSYFSQMLTTSITPQIMKSKGENNIERLLYLSVLTSKLSSFLSFIFAVPLIIEIDFVLKLWLGKVPQYADFYCMSTIAIFLIMQLYPGLNRAIQADGRIKWYNIWLTVILLSPILLSIVLFKMGMEHQIIMVLMVAAQVGVMVMTIWQSHKLLGLSLFLYGSFLAKAMAIFVGTILLCLWVKHYLLNVSEWEELFVVTALSTLTIVASFYCFVATASERDILKKMLLKYVKKGN